MSWKGSHNFFGNDYTSPVGAYHPGVYQPPQQYPVAPTYPPNTVTMDQPHLTRADANPKYSRIKEFFKGHRKDPHLNQQQTQYTATPNGIPIPDLSTVLTDSQSLSRYPTMGYQVAPSAGSTMHPHPHRRLPERNPNHFDGRPNLRQINDWGVMKNPSREPRDEDPDSSSDSEGERTPPNGVWISQHHPSLKNSYPQYASHPYDAPPPYSYSASHYVYPDTHSTRSRTLSVPSSPYQPSLIHSQYGVAPSQTSSVHSPHGSEFHRMVNHGLLAAPVPSAHGSSSGRSGRSEKRSEKSRHSRSHSQPRSSHSSNHHHHRHSRSSSQPRSSHSSSGHGHHHHSSHVPKSAPIAIPASYTPSRHSDSHGHSHSHSTKHHDHDGHHSSTRPHSWNPPSAFSSHRNRSENGAVLHPRFDIPMRNGYLTVPEDRSRSSRPPLTPPPHPRPFDLRDGRQYAYRTPVYPNI